MLENKILGALVNRTLKEGSVRITDWKGQSRVFGGFSEPVEFTLDKASVVWRLLRHASIATGEAFTEGALHISDDDLLRFFELVFKNRSGGRLRQPVLRLPNVKRLQQRHISHHYDLPTAYYQRWLDESFLQYSSAYWGKGVASLEEAQEKKLAVLMAKLQLQPGQRVLDIGCGWGHLAVELARRQKVQVVAVTLSTEQLAYAKSLVAKGGPAEDVGDLVEFREQNYLDITDEPFDRIISVGMFEHVGRRNQADFFKAAKKLLVPGGVMVLHTITQQKSRPVDAWVAKHVFPGGYLPRVSQITGHIEKAGLWLHASEDLYPSYAKTLEEWEKRHRAQREQIIHLFEELAAERGMRLTGSQLYRLRQYWLKASEAAFRWGDIGVNQFMVTNGKQENQPTLDLIY